MANFYVNEGKSHQYTATLQDAAEVAIPSADLTTLTLTLYDVDTGDIINSRNAQDVLNTNNVTVHATSGLLTWILQPLDNVIVTSASHVEGHVALFEWRIASSGQDGNHEVNIHVHNLSKVT